MQAMPIAVYQAEQTVQDYHHANFDGVTDANREWVNTALITGSATPETLDTYISIGGSRLGQGGQPGRQSE